MANPSNYAGVPGFNIDIDDAPAPSTPPLERSLIDNHELITDLARFSEALCTESAIRKKWRLSEDTWELLGSSDELVRAIEEEKTRRIRSGQQNGSSRSSISFADPTFWPRSWTIPRRMRAAPRRQHQIQKPQFST